MKRNFSKETAAGILCLGFLCRSALPCDAAQLKVLAIGSSFSRPCVESLPPVARALGVDLDIASLYIGGCSLERHWKNIETAETNATFRPYRFDRNTSGRKTAIDGRISIQEALTAAKWDVVTIQQASHKSWRAGSYFPLGRPSRRVRPRTRASGADIRAGDVELHAARQASCEMEYLAGRNVFAAARGLCGVRGKKPRRRHPGRHCRADVARTLSRPPSQGVAIS